MSETNHTDVYANELFDLSGHAAFVTGGGWNVGAGISRRLAQRGAAVAVNDINVERAESVAAEIRSAGGRAVAAPADVTDADAVKAAIDAAARELGTIDILVNNAGVPPSGFTISRFVDSAPAEWDKYLKISLYGVMYCVHAALPAMIEQQWGRIVTIVSDAGRFGEPSMAAYSAAKAGAAGFMRSVSKEVGRFNITSNAISLGSIEPPEPTEADAQRAKLYPMKRLGRPNDIAAGVVWLASPDAGWITGQTISVNGGYNSSP